MTVLETQLGRARHGFNGEAWGTDIFPVYGEAREGRARRWDEYDDAKQTRELKIVLDGGDPWTVPEGVPRYSTRRGRVCDTHQKFKCGKCRTIKECCERHHEGDSDLPVRYCEDHRMTVCAACGTLNECCRRKHHHRCLEHDMPTCEDCMKLPDLRSRRPRQCCRRGHHQAQQRQPQIQQQGQQQQQCRLPTAGKRKCSLESTPPNTPTSSNGQRQPKAAKVKKLKQAPTPETKPKTSPAPRRMGARKRGAPPSTPPKKKREKKTTSPGRKRNRKRIPDESPKRGKKRKPESDTGEEQKRRKHDSTRSKR